MIDPVPSTSHNNSPEVARETAKQQVKNLERKEGIHMYIGFIVRFHIKLEIFFGLNVKLVNTCKIHC